MQLAKVTERQLWCLQAWGEKWRSPLTTGPHRLTGWGNLPNKRIPHYRIFHSRIISSGSTSRSFTVFPHMNSLQKQKDELLTHQYFIFRPYARQIHWHNHSNLKSWQCIHSALFFFYATFFFLLWLVKHLKCCQKTLVAIKAIPHIQ